MFFISVRQFKGFIAGSFLSLLMFSGAFAQEQSPDTAISAPQAVSVSPEIEHVYQHPQVLSSWQLASENIRIYLWGVEPVESADAVFKLRARTALSQRIGEGNIKCTLKSEQKDFVLAQCVNDKNEDLSLFLLQNGYVTAQRSMIYGTIFEEPYVQAEAAAQASEGGVWGGEQPSDDKMSGKQTRNFFFAAVLFFAAGVLGLGYISFYIMRGFGKVVDVQNKTLDLAVKERHLKEKERFVVAAMLDSEVRENKNKIDAYLVVYEEVLRDLSDTARTPKYKKSGDIIQKQPSLGRSVFDGNTDRLDLMGQFLASDLIHYYARIKTIPDYVEIDSETPQDDVVKLVKVAVDQAQKLNVLSLDLIKKFVSSGLVKRDVN